MTGSLARVLLLFALALSAHAAPGDDADTVQFAFAALGDTPYNTDEEEQFIAMLAELNRSDLAFVVHIGDFKSSTTICSDELYLQRRDWFRLSHHPLVYVPGDNEWTDCWRPFRRRVRADGASRAATGALLGGRSKPGAIAALRRSANGRECAAIPGISRTLALDVRRSAVRDAQSPRPRQQPHAHAGRSRSTNHGGPRMGEDLVRARTRAEASGTRAVHAGESLEAQRGATSRVRRAAS